MKKLFLFCLLASFALASNSFAGPKKATTFLGDDGSDWGTPDPDTPGTPFNPVCNTSTYNLHSCPNNAICKECKDIDGAHYRVTGCKSGYKKVGNKCIKNPTRDATPTKVVPTTSVTRTVTTKRKK